MSETEYYVVWADNNIEDIIKKVESNNKPKKVVIIGPEEYEFPNLFDSPRKFIMFKRFFDFHNVELHMIAGGAGDKFLNPNYSMLHYPNTYLWDTFFAHFIVSYSLNRGLMPYGHNEHLKKHFVSLNGRAHSWRCRFIDHMYKRSLFDYGYVSWHNSDRWNYEYKFRWWQPRLLKFDKHWLQNTDGYLDIFIPPDEFKDSLFSVISESNTNCLFITEKTWLPIYHKRPFIIFGAPNSHAWLKSKGIQMFEEVIDYSFDSVTNEEKRCSMMMDQVEKLCKYDIEDLRKLVKDKVDQNYKQMMYLISNKKAISKGVKRLVSEYNQENTSRYNELLNISNHTEFSKLLI